MILGVTPVRGGSKGVPRKNIRMVCGKPLIAWTIEAARRSELLDRYLVSTEDAEIAEIARERDAEVLERPPELATDEASTVEVLRHVLRRVPAEVVVLLQATSPIREPDLIDKCITRFIETGSDSLATGFVSRLTEYGSSTRRRQDIEGFFCDDGNIYVIKSDLVLKGDRFGRRVERMVTSREQNIEIDDEFDLWLAERVLEAFRAGEGWAAGTAGQ